MGFPNTAKDGAGYKEEDQAREKCKQSVEESRLGTTMRGISAL